MLQRMWTSSVRRKWSGKSRKMSSAASFWTFRVLSGNASVWYQRQTPKCFTSSVPTMCAPTGETPPHKFVTPWKRLWTIAMTTGRDQSRIERPISALVSYFYCYINYFANVAKKMTTLFRTKDPRQQFPVMERKCL